MIIIAYLLDKCRHLREDKNMFFDEGTNDSGISHGDESDPVRQAKDTDEDDTAPGGREKFLQQIAQIFPVVSSMVDQRQQTKGEAEQEAIKEVAKNSEMSAELLTGLRTIHKQAASKGEDGRLLAPTIESIANEYNKLGEAGLLPSEDLPTFIELMHPELNPADKEKIVGHLAVTVTAEQDDEGEDWMPLEARERAEALRNDMEEPINEMYKKVRSFMGIRDIDEKMQQKIALLEGMLDKYSERLNRFLTPDDPVKTWTKRGIKMNFKILEYIWYLFIIECAIVNRMTRKQGR